MSNDTDAKTAEAPATNEMTVEEKKFLMISLWESLIEPKWTKDNLIDFGTAIFAKKRLAEMSDGEFSKVFPFLNTVTVALGTKMVAKQREIENAEKTNESDSEKKTEEKAEEKSEEKTERKKK